MLETTPLEHGALLSSRGRRERKLAFSSPANATGRPVNNYHVAEAVSPTNSNFSIDR
ncbi:hypothetical protein [Bradyrhizobium monzae]|uniref:hypothetical protein n=1 Tax=Bradyrhizobium sp. Oc8 TaxID=2876780 RepID=UPI001F19DCBE|nr:hypothetical protein [Bradyrhizobium sp. Oc8]